MLAKEKFNNTGFHRQLMQYVSEWLNSYPKKSTRRVFKAGVMHFLNHIYGEGELEAQAEKYVQEYRSGLRDPFKDMLSYAASSSDRPPMSAGSYATGVKSFLEYTLNIEFSRKQSRLIHNRLPKGKARTVEAEITRGDLKAILNQCDLKGRALFLFLASTGMRIGEALQIMPDDVDLEADPPTVLVRQQYTKTGAQYYTFLTTEAKEALSEWLKVREAYIQSALNRGRGLSKTAPGRGVKNPEDKRVFPFSKPVAEQVWYNAIEKAGLNHRDPSTGRYRWHIHMLRKWFLSQGKAAPNVPENIIEALAGHIRYLDDAYRRYTRQQLAEFYKKAEPYILINVPEGLEPETIEETKSTVLDIAKNMVKLQNENEELRKKLSKFESENEDLRRRIGEADERLNRLEKLIQKAIEDQSASDTKMS